MSCGSCCTRIIQLEGGSAGGGPYTVTQNPDGTVTVTDQTSGNQFVIPMDMAQTIVSGDAGNLIVVGTDDGAILTATAVAAELLSSDAGNALVLGADGLLYFAPAADMFGPSADAGNVLTAGADGLAFLDSAAVTGAVDFTILTPTQVTDLVGAIDFTQLSAQQCADILACIDFTGLTAQQAADILGEIDFSLLTTDQCGDVINCVVDNITPTQAADLLTRFDMAGLTDAQCDAIAACILSTDAGNIITLGTDGGLYTQGVTVDLRLVSGSYNPATQTIELIVDDGAGGSVSTVNVPVAALGEEVGSVTGPVAGTAAPAGTQLGVDPATGALYYVDGAGNYQTAPDLHGPSSDAGNLLTAGGDDLAFIDAATITLAVDFTALTPQQITDLVGAIDFTQLTPAQCSDIIDCVVTNMSAGQAADMLDQLDFTGLSDAQCDAIAACIVSADADNQLVIGTDGGLYVPEGATEDHIHCYTSTTTLSNPGTLTENFGSFVAADTDYTLTYSANQVLPVSASPASGSAGIWIGTTPGASDVLSMGQAYPPRLGGDPAVLERTATVTGLTVGQTYHVTGFVGGSTTAADGMSVTLVSACMDQVVGSGADLHGPSTDAGNVLTPGGDNLAFLDAAGLTAAIDPNLLTGQQLDDLCAALAAAGCDLTPAQLMLAIDLDCAINANETNTTWAPVGVSQVANPGPVGANDLSGSPVLPVTTNVAADFPDTFVNPPGAFVDQIWDPQLPSGTTRFSATFSDPSNSGGAYGVTAFDVTTGLSFPPNGEFDGTVSVGASAFGEWILPPGVSAGDVMLLMTGVGSTIANNESVVITNPIAVTSTPTTIDYTATVTNNGTNPEAGITVDMPPFGQTGLAVSPDPIPAGGTGTATYTYNIQPSDIAGGQVATQAVVTQDTSIQVVDTKTVTTGTQLFECNQLDFRTRLPAPGAPQDAASILEGSTALDTAAFTAPGYIHDLGTTWDGPFDTLVNLDLPATATGFSFSINLVGSAAGPITYGFVDRTTGLRVDLAALTSPGTVNAFQSGATLTPGTSGTANGTLPAGVDPRNVDMVFFDLGAAGAPQKFMILTNFTCI